MQTFRYVVSIDVGHGVDGSNLKLIVEEAIKAVVVVGTVKVQAVSHVAEAQKPKAPEPAPARTESA